MSADIIMVIIYILSIVVLAPTLFGLGAYWGYRLAEDRIYRPRRRNRRMNSPRRMEIRAEREIEAIHKDAEITMEAIAQAAIRHSQNKRRGWRDRTD